MKAAGRVPGHRFVIGHAVGVSNSRHSVVAQVRLGSGPGLNYLKDAIIIHGSLLAYDIYVQEVGFKFRCQGLWIVI